MPDPRADLKRAIDGLDPSDPAIPALIGLVESIPEMRRAGTPARRAGEIAGGEGVRPDPTQGEALP